MKLAIVWGRNCLVARVAGKTLVTGGGYVDKGQVPNQKPWLAAVLVSPSGTLEKSPYLGMVLRNPGVCR